MAVVLTKGKVYSLCGRMRFARWMVGTQLGVFADDACLAGHVLVTLDLALSTRITSLYSVAQGQPEFVGQ